MKEIQLSQGKVALVDDADYEYLNQFKWYAIKDQNTYYAARTLQRKTTQMHRVILGLENPKIEADHIDHNGLNNQRNNLRIATRSQNCSNRPVFKNSFSGYRGVSWHIKNKKWTAYLRKGGVRQYLGTFQNKEDAALAYNKAAKVYHGEFANLNVVM